MLQDGEVNHANLYHVRNTEDNLAIEEAEHLSDDVGFFELDEEQKPKINTRTEGDCVQLELREVGLLFLSVLYITAIASENSSFVH